MNKIICKLITAIIIATFLFQNIGWAELPICKQTLAPVSEFAKLASKIDLEMAGIGNTFILWIEKANIHNIAQLVARLSKNSQIREDLLRKDIWVLFYSDRIELIGPKFTLSFLDANKYPKGGLCHMPGTNMRIDLYKRTQDGVTRQFLYPTNDTGEEKIIGEFTFTVEGNVAGEPNISPAILEKLITALNASRNYYAEQPPTLRVRLVAGGRYYGITDKDNNDKIITIEINDKDGEEPFNEIALHYEVGHAMLNMDPLTEEIALSMLSLQLALSGYRLPPNTDNNPCVQIVIDNIRNTRSLKKHLENILSLLTTSWVHTELESFFGGLTFSEILSALNGFLWWNKLGATNLEDIPFTQIIDIAKEITDFVRILKPIRKKCEISETKNDMCSKAAEYFVEEVNRLIEEKGKAVVCFATGNTPKGMYKIIREKYRDKVKWEKVITFNLDEYVFPETAGDLKNHPKSFRYFMEEELFKYLPIPQENIHFLNGVKQNIDEFEKAISECGGIDLCVLGIGQNGHIAFNEPGSSFKSPVRQAELSERTRIDNRHSFDGKVENVPRYALTMGIREIMASRKIILLASGESKADAVKNALYGPVTEDCPASILQKHQNVKYYLDKGAFGGSINKHTPQRFAQSLENLLRIPVRKFIPRELEENIKRINKGKEPRYYSFNSLRQLRRFCRWTYWLRPFKKDDIVVVRLVLRSKYNTQVIISALTLSNLKEFALKMKKQEDGNLIDWEKTYFSIVRNFESDICVVRGGGIYLDESLRKKGLAYSAYRLFFRRLVESGLGGYPFRVFIEHPEFFQFMYHILDGRIDTTNHKLLEDFIDRFERIGQEFQEKIADFKKDPKGNSREFLYYLIELYDKRAKLDWNELKAPVEGIIPDLSREQFEEMTSSAQMLKRYIDDGRISKLIPEWDKWIELYVNPNFRNYHTIPPSAHIILAFERLESDYFKEIIVKNKLAGIDIVRLRRALFLHDFGKITVLEQDPDYKYIMHKNHPHFSASIAEKIFARLGYDPTEIADDLLFMRYHQVLSDLAQFGEGQVSPLEFVNSFKHTWDLRILQVLQLVDAASVMPEFENSLSMGLERRVNEICDMIEKILLAKGAERQAKEKKLLDYLTDIKRQNEEIMSAFGVLKNIVNKPEYKIEISEDILQRVFNVMHRSHMGQIRDDEKTPTVIHPIRTAMILVEELGVRDPAWIIAALLHDVLEDTRTTTSAIKELFGEDVASIVTLLSKPDVALYHDKYERDMDYYHRLIYGADEIRDRKILTAAQTIKIADRIHNLRTLTSDNAKKQINETYENFIFHFIFETEVSAENKRILIRELIEQGENRKFLTEEQRVMLGQFKDKIVKFELPELGVGMSPYNLVRGLIEFKRQEKPNVPVVLAFDGMSGVGRSAFTAQLQEQLQKIGRKVVVFDANDYLMPRDIRDKALQDAQKKGMTYYLQREELYDFKRFRKEVLERLQGFRQSLDRSKESGKSPGPALSISLSKIYNRETGKLDAKKSYEIDSDTVILIEGMHILQEDFLPFYDATFKVHAPKEVCLENVLQRERDKEKGKQPEDIVGERFERLDWPSYTKHWVEYWMASGFIIDNTDYSRRTAKVNPLYKFPKEFHKALEEFINPEKWLNRNLENIFSQLRNKEIQPYNVVYGTNNSIGIFRNLLAVKDISHLIPKDIPIPLADADIDTLAYFLEQISTLSNGNIVDLFLRFLSAYILEEAESEIVFDENLLRLEEKLSSISLKNPEDINLFKNAFNSIQGYRKFFRPLIADDWKGKEEIPILLDGDALKEYSSQIILALTRLKSNLSPNQRIHIILAHAGKGEEEVKAISRSFYDLISLGSVSYESNNIGIEPMAFIIYLQGKLGSFYKYKLQDILIISPPDSPYQKICGARQWLTHPRNLIFDPSFPQGLALSILSKHKWEKLRKATTCLLYKSEDLYIKAPIEGRVFVGDNIRYLILRNKFFRFINNLFDKYYHIKWVRILKEFIKRVIHFLIPHRIIVREYTDGYKLVLEKAPHLMAPTRIIGDGDLPGKIKLEDMNKDTTKLVVQESSELLLIDHIRSLVSQGNWVEVENILTSAFHFLQEFWKYGLADIDYKMNILGNLVLDKKGQFKTVDAGSVTDNENAIRDYLSIRTGYADYVRKLFVESNTLKSLGSALYKKDCFMKTIGTLLEHFDDETATRIFRIFLNVLIQKYDLEDFGLLWKQDKFIADTMGKIAKDNPKIVVFYNKHSPLEPLEAVVEKIKNSYTPSQILFVEFPSDYTPLGYALNSYDYLYSAAQEMSKCKQILEGYSPLGNQEFGEALLKFIGEVKKREEEISQLHEQGFKTGNGVAMRLIKESLDKIISTITSSLTMPNADFNSMLQALSQQNPSLRDEEELLVKKLAKQHPSLHFISLHGRFIQMGEHFEHERPYNHIFGTKAAGRAHIPVMEKAPKIGSYSKWGFVRNSFSSDLLRSQVDPEHFDNNISYTFFELPIFPHPSDSLPIDSDKLIKAVVGSYLLQDPYFATAKAEKYMNMDYFRRTPLLEEARDSIAEDLTEYLNLFLEHIEGTHAVIGGDIPRGTEISIEEAIKLLKLLRLALQTPPSPSTPLPYVKGFEQFGRDRLLEANELDILIKILEEYLSQKPKEIKIIAFKRKDRGLFIEKVSMPTSEPSPQETEPPPSPAGAVKPSEPPTEAGQLTIPLPNVDQPPPSPSLASPIPLGGDEDKRFSDISKLPLDQRIEALEEILKIQPDNVHAVYLLAIIWTKLGWFKKALELIEKTLENAKIAGRADKTPGTRKLEWVELQALKLKLVKIIEDMAETEEHGDRFIMPTGYGSYYVERAGVSGILCMQVKPGYEKIENGEIIKFAETREIEGEKGRETVTPEYLEIMSIDKVSAPEMPKAAGQAKIVMLPVHLANKYACELLEDRLKENGINISTSEPVNKYTPEEVSSFARALEETSPNIIGISGHGLLEIKEINMLVRAIKKEIPGAFIVLGGACANFPKQLLALLGDFSDIILVRGEGEAVLTELCKIIGNKSAAEDLTIGELKAISELSGGIYLRHKSRILLNRLDIYNINQKIHIPMPRKKTDEYGLRASEGCPFNCKFCNDLQFRTKKMRYVDLEELKRWFLARLQMEFKNEITFEELEKKLKSQEKIDELKKLEENKITIMFWDDNFLINKNRVKEMVQMFNLLGLGRYFIFRIAQAHINTIAMPGKVFDNETIEFMDFLKSSGFSQINFGTDDLSSMPRMGKGYNITHVVNVNKMLRERGSIAHNNVIITTPDTTLLRLIEALLLFYAMPIHYSENINLHTGASMGSIFTNMAILRNPEYDFSASAGNVNEYGYADLGYAYVNPKYRDKAYLKFTSPLPMVVENQDAIFGSIMDDLLERSNKPQDILFIEDAIGALMANEAAVKPYIEKIIAGWKKLRDSDPELSALAELLDGDTDYFKNIIRIQNLMNLYGFYSFIDCLAYLKSGKPHEKEDDIEKISLHITNKQYPEALKILESLREKQPQNTAILFLMAKVCILIGDLDRAEQIASEIYRYNSGTRYNLSLLAKIKILRNPKDTAISQNPLADDTELPSDKTGPPKSYTGKGGTDEEANPVIKTAFVPDLRILTPIFELFAVVAEQAARDIVYEKINLMEWFSFAGYENKPLAEIFRQAVQEISARITHDVPPAPLQQDKIAQSMAWHALEMVGANEQFKGKVVYSLSALLESGLNDSKGLERLKAFVTRTKDKVFFYAGDRAIGNYDKYGLPRDRLITKDTLKNTLGSEELAIFMLNKGDMEHLELNNSNIGKLKGNQFIVPIEGIRDVENDMLLGYELIRNKGNTQELPSLFKLLLAEAIEDWLKATGEIPTRKRIEEILQTKIPEPRDYSKDIERAKEILTSL